jgi:hypothetical protein
MRAQKTAIPSSQDPDNDASMQSPEEDSEQSPQSAVVRRTRSANRARDDTTQPQTLGKRVASREKHLLSSGRTQTNAKKRRFCTKDQKAMLEDGFLVEYIDLESEIVSRFSSNCNFFKVTLK